MNRLKIIIDANILSRGMTKGSNRSGIFFMAFNLVNELIKSGLVDVCFFINDSQHELKKSLNNEWGKYGIDFFLYKPLFLYKFSLKIKKYKSLYKIVSAFLDYQKNKKNHLMNDFIKLHNYTVFLSLLNKIPGVVSQSDLKKFTVLYDVIPLLSESIYRKKGLIQDNFCWNWFYNIFNSINYEDYYLAISNHTRNDFIKHSKTIDPNKVFVTYLPCGDSFVPKKITADIKKKYGIPVEKKYLFSLFNLEPRKNFDMAIRAFIVFTKKNKIDDLCFVLGGATWDGVESWIKKYIPEANDNPNIIRTGYIDDEDIPALYSGSEWFVYTSKYEGFGLPPLEAMRCGCPVIVSNSSSLPEVVGEAGIQVDCDDLQQHVGAYERYYFDRQFKEESISKGFIQAKTFSWHKTVDEVIRIMNSVCK